MHYILQSLLIAALGVAVSANPHLMQYDWHTKRQNGYLRSPCPALNALANEGIINTNGANIKLTDLQAALQNTYNLDTTLAASLVYTGKFLTSNTTQETLTPTLELDDLAKHYNALEHDASLTRLDYSEGDQVHLQQDLLDAMLADSPTNYLTVESLARTRVRREDHSNSIGNSGTDAKTVTLAYIEAAVILLALGKTNDANGNPMSLKTDVSRWFAEERLPIGFTKPANQIGFDDQLAMVAKLQAAAAKVRAGQL